MSTEITKSLPTVAELAKQDKMQSMDVLNILLNKTPPAKFLKRHPTITVKVIDQNGNERSVPHEYIPVDKQRLMAKRIFGGFSVEILTVQQMFQSVVVTVRVKVINPITGEQMQMDGVGAVGVQTDKGASAADLSKIKFDAISKAAPAAATYAEKNAWDKFGRLFGGEVQKDAIQFNEETAMYARPQFHPSQVNEQNNEA